MKNKNLTGFLTLIEREGYRFSRLFRQTVIPPMITVVMFILIFGYSLGSRIKEINGFSYILFILPGLIQMSVINNAFANTSSSLFAARLERSIENFIVAPISPVHLAISFIAGGLMRGLVVGAVIFMVASFFVNFPIHNFFIIFLSVVLSSILFGSLGLIVGLLAESWDKISVYTNFILTPLVYLGGVFYSTSMLDFFWQKASLFNPVFYSVDLIRFGFLGISDISVYFSLTLLSLFCLFVLTLCFILFIYGYKLLK